MSLPPPKSKLPIFLKKVPNSNMSWETNYLASSIGIIHITEKGRNGRAYPSENKSRAGAATRTRVRAPSQRNVAVQATARRPARLALADLPCAASPAPTALPPTSSSSSRLLLTPLKAPSKLSPHSTPQFTRPSSSSLSFLGSRPILIRLLSLFFLSPPCRSRTCLPALFGRPALGSCRVRAQRVLFASA